MSGVFRIVVGVGADGPARAEPVAGLRTLLQREGLRIDASADLALRARPDGSSWLLAGHVDGRRTPAGVRRLGVGQVAHLRGGQVELEERPFVPVATQPFEDANLNDYAEALLESVRARASSDGNVVYLSSGWDSTAILACLVHLFGPERVRDALRTQQMAGIAALNHWILAEFAAETGDGVEVRGAEMNDLLALCVLTMTGWYGAN